MTSCQFLPSFIIIFFRFLARKHKLHRSFSFAHKKQKTEKINKIYNRRYTAFKLYKRRNYKNDQQHSQFFFCIFIFASTVTIANFCKKKKYDRLTEMIFSSLQKLFNTKNTVNSLFFIPIYIFCILNYHQH